MQKPGAEVTVVEAKPPVLKLNQAAIATITENIQLAQQLVVNVLEKDIDYGRTPGIPTDSLWDPGAAKIMAAFNCYASHKVLFHEESDDLISWTIQAEIINRDTQQLVATGLGAASTREPKYHYRWVTDPQNYGYTEAEIAELKVRESDIRHKKYRIENPEYGELVNTLLQISAKRAEVDATKSLPGVGSALRRLFDGKQMEPDFARFWANVKSMGIKEEAIHKLLGVTSMKDWVAKGRSLEDAVILIAQKLTEFAARQAKEPRNQGKKEADDNPPATHPEEIKDIDTLVSIAKEEFGLSEKAMWQKLGYSSRQNYQEAAIDELSDCLAKLRMGRQTPTEEEPPTDDLAF